MRFRKAVSGLLACVIAAASVFAADAVSVRADTGSGTAAYVQAAEPGMAYAQDDVTESGLVADYDFSRTVDGKLKDKSPCGNDAAVHGEVQCDKDAGVMALREGCYVALPMGIIDSLADAEAFTVEMKFAKDAGSGDESWLFCLGSEADADPLRDTLFFTPNSGRGMEVRVINGPDVKTLAKFGQARDNQYYTVNMTFDHGKINLYVDGRRVGTAEGIDTGCSIVNDVIGPGTENNVLGFIGRSCKGGGSDFTGSIASFKIYDRAMEAAEVFEDRFSEIEDKDFFTQAVLGKNQDREHIAYNLSLPVRVGDYESVTWESEPDVIAGDGEVINPRAGDTDVILTARAKRGNDLEAVRKFKVRVLRLDTSPLQAVINSLGRLQKTDYTGESWAAYAAALTKAQEAVTRNIQVGQSGLEELQNMLQDSYHALRRQFKVTFDYGYAGAPSVMAVAVEAGNRVDKAKFPQNPVRKGYKFAGWYSGSNAFDSGDLVTGNIALKARWTRVYVSIKKASVKVSKATYNSKARKPKVTVKYKGRKLRAGKDYTVRYKNNKKIGRASVTVKGKGGYNGNKTVKFNIVPKPNKITKAANKKGKKLEIKFSRSSGAAGYEVSYAANRKFKSAKRVRTGKTYVVLKKLRRGTYYVRVRAYKKAGKKIYYSDYSKAKSIRVRK